MSTDRTHLSAQKKCSWSTDWTRPKHIYNFITTLMFYFTSTSKFPGNNYVTLNKKTKKTLESRDGIQYIPLSLYDQKSNYCKRNVSRFFSRQCIHSRAACKMNTKWIMNDHLLGFQLSFSFKDILICSQMNTGENSCFRWKRRRRERASEWAKAVCAIKIQTDETEK